MMTIRPARFLARLRPPAGAAAGQRDLALEALRGICAGLVFYAHVFFPAPALDPVYAPSARFWWFNLGGVAVLMFFVMSGYAIGLSVRTPFSTAGARHYLGRRALRLLPVGTAAVLLAWLLRPETDGHTVMGNLLFLQNDFPYPVVGWSFPTLLNNAALWTLNFEALYYLVFLLVWWLAPSIPLLAGSLALLIFGPSLGIPVPDMVTHHACGAIYWMAGLGLAWLTGSPGDQERLRTPWPSALLGAYALWTIGGLRAVLLTADSSSLLWLSIVSPHRLDFLPAALWCVLAVTGRAPRLRGIMAGACLAWGWFGVVFSWSTNQWGENHWLGAAALLAATGLAGWAPGLGALRRLAPLGTVSFGIYAFASPLQIALCGLLPGFSGSPFTFAVRLTIVAGGTLALAWLFDRRLQAWLAARRSR